MPPFERATGKCGRASCAQEQEREQDDQEPFHEVIPIESTLDWNQLIVNAKSMPHELAELSSASPCNCFLKIRNAAVSRLEPRNPRSNRSPENDRSVMGSLEPEGISSVDRVVALAL